MRDATAETTGDHRRWLVLATVSAAVVVVALDTTILNVAIPTITRDLHTDLASMQWVITGYSLTLGSLLIIGGRLGDLFGTRRTFIAGTLVFAAGSLLASTATSVWMLVLGESVVEGIGAALLMPATLATISMAFTDRERAKAFAVWGGAAGASAALGPVVGGWLTTDFSWRWGFLINLVVAPVAALAARTLLPGLTRQDRRPRLDVSGAAVAAIGLVLLVFAITEGTGYGWLTAQRSVIIAGVVVWPASAPLSPVPVAFAAAAIAFAWFVAIEHRKQRSAGAPLLELDHFRLPSFRFGLAAAAAVVMAQSGALFVLAVFLQTTRHLSAVQTGVWLLPVGLAVVVGAQVGGQLANGIGATIVVRLGIVVELTGVAATAAALRPDISLVTLAPTLAVFGLGAGLANSQLTNIILADVPGDRASSASGAATTNNAIAAALGIAIVATTLRAVPATGAGAARWALLAAAAIAAAGVLTSLAIPRTTHETPLDQRRPKGST
jgi:EmrB/QacA subfamily drug resistance transporter